MSKDVPPKHQSKGSPRSASAASDGGHGAPGAIVLAAPRRDWHRSRLMAMLPRAVRRTVRRARCRLTWLQTRVVENFANTDRKRMGVALSLALILNLALMSSMALFGQFRIPIPNAPQNIINIALISQSADPIYPQLRDSAIIIEPEPAEPDPVELDPVEPEPVVPEPEPEPEPVEPEPEPEPVEPEPEPEPEPVEPAPEPEPVEPEPATPELDLLLTEEFTAPGDRAEVPLIPDPASAPPPVEEAEVAPEVVVASPDIEDAPPVPEVEERIAQDEAVTDDVQIDAALEELIAELSDAGTDEEEAGEEAETTASEALSPEDILRALQARNFEARNPGAPSSNASIVTNDDIFDREPVFGARAGRLAGAPRQRLPLVELPEIALEDGTSGALAGASGVIAIFCEEQFSDPNKIAECAGRVQILSGWQPGDSGEDYSRAIALIREAKANGRGNARDLARVIGPEQARIVQSLDRAVALTDRSGSALSTIGDPTAGSVFDGVDLGPGALGPPIIRQDPIFSERERREFDRAQRDLERAFRDAEKAAKDGDPDDDQ